MNPIIAFLRLIRIQNLLIIALTQYLLRWCVLGPLLAHVRNDFVLQMSELNFFLLSLSTVMIAAAGNIINDYFDLKIDRINKPDRIIVGRYIKRRVAMAAHIVINAIALLIGLYVSWAVGKWQLAAIHVFAAVSLWYYATNFKRQFLLGNFIIAFLAAIVPVVVGLFEMPLINAAYLEIVQRANSQYTLNFLAFWTLGYGGFAFLLTLAREITKDIEDVEGDRKHDCRTLPIVSGTDAAKKVVMVLYSITLLALGWLLTEFLHDPITLTYVGLLICLPLLVLIWMTWKANSKKALHRASNVNKLVSVFGILYTLVVFYLFHS